MSLCPDVFNVSEEDVRMMLIGQVHLGTSNQNRQMAPYFFGRQANGVFVFDLNKTWQKLVFAARVLATVDPEDICVVGKSTNAARAIHKFCKFTGAQSIVGRFTPGAFTNRISPNYREPRILIVHNPIEDHQAILESAYANIPIIAFCNSESPLRYVDVAIPCNNRSDKSVGLMYWMLAREVQRIRGELKREDEMCMPDLFVNITADQMEKIANQEAEEAEEAEEKEKQGDLFNTEEVVAEAEQVQAEEVDPFAN